jgi:fumarate reductase flavoprotein subunit
VTEAPDAQPLVLATGGFSASRAMLRKQVTAQAGELFLRCAPGSTGDGLRIGCAAGAVTSPGMDQVYARAMPAPPALVGPNDLVRLSQLYAGHAEVTNQHGQHYRTKTWSEIDVVQWTARQRKARAWYAVPDEAMNERVRDRTVGEMVEAARAAGGPVVRRGSETVVEVVAGVTTTLGGLRVDERARAADGIYAAGTDVGGISTGGYSSGLAAALVLGLTAAETVAGGA